MRSLDVESERYVQSIHIETDMGKRSHSSDTRELGEVSLSPVPEGESFIPLGPRRLPRRLVIGSAGYEYSLKFARCDGGRPWLRWKRPGASPAAFPYQGLSGASKSRYGAYGGLIELLGTARGAVDELGMVTLEGQETREFTATVDPAKLASGSSSSEGLTAENERILISQLKLHSLPTRLKLFITRSGLPLRVVASASIGPSYALTETIDVLAENTPVRPMHPAERQTISEAEVIKLFAHDSNRCGLHVFSSSTSIKARNGRQK